MKCQCYLLQTARQALQDVKGIVTQISLQGHLILVLATLTCSSSGRGRSWFPRGFLFSGSCGMSCDVLVTMVKKKMSFSCKRNDSALLLNGGSANVLSEKSQETAAAGVEGHLPEAPLFRCRFWGQWNSRLVTKRRRGAWVFAVPRGAEGGDSEAIKFLWLKLL